MIWQNTWAWLGLLALAVPVLIHLLGRRSARVQRFPTLRFIEATPPVATRRTRLTDIPLLLVRTAILAAAVAALAGPLLLTADRERDLGRSVARAVIVDTSASVAGDMAQGGAVAGAQGAGATQRGARPIELARREAARLAGAGGTAVRLETRSPALAIPGAVAWLDRQPGRRELVIISDFQVGSIDSADLALVPSDVGIGLVQVATEAPASYEVITRRGAEEIVARATPASGSVAPAMRGAVAVDWAVRPSLSARDEDETIILAGTGERTRAEAARRAAVSAGVSLVQENHPIAVVYPDYEGRDGLLRDARPLAALWQGDFVARLASDPLLIAAAAIAEIAPVGVDSVLASDPLPPPFVALARSLRGEAIVVAAAGRVDARDRLLIVVRADAGSLISAATLAAIERAGRAAAPLAELEPARVAESTLSAWRRAPAEAKSTRTSEDDGASDGRWLWVLALILLGVETLMRRGQRTAKSNEVVHERAA